MNFRVAVLQTPSPDRNPSENTKTIISRLEEAARLEADILLIPECFITGYALPIEYDKALSDNDVCITDLCYAARKLKVGVVATTFTKGKKKPQNSAYVIDKNGRILMKYSKVHTCDFADEICLESGKDFTAVSYTHLFFCCRQLPGISGYQQVN